MLPTERAGDIATGPGPGLIAPVVAATTRPLQTAQTDGHFGVHSETFALMTEDQSPGFYDVTDLVAAVIKRSGLAAGTFTASTRHTTCAMVVQGNDPRLLQDMADRLGRFAGADETDRHDGHAHCQHLLLGADVTLPILEGRPVLGLWQRIFLVELDRAHARQFSVQAMGVYANQGRAFPW